MRKIFKRLNVVVTTILLVTLLSATVVAADTQDLGEYVDVVVTIQIYCLDTGDVISTEYSYVTLSVEEFEEEATSVIQPRIPIRRVINFPLAFPAMQNVASASSFPGSAYLLRIEYEHGTLPSVRFEVRTNTLDTLLGARTLNRGEGANVSITGGTLSYTVMMGSGSGSGSGMIGIFINR
ncbi:MAG: hypothetical protein FWC91_08405 [Defluviitaleaceae bacterium]|nr:hypothetical protein [Defluviitaleaceae bacterium]